ncbi:HNH endonuclease [Candidatus Poriferisodalis sp.]|uniref:HNH endonuclease signature motif containing protein n=1 Tax=Candidatus Poriferisodalis sp. TaxID=3101277 RepID=UPI003B0189CA
MDDYRGSASHQSDGSHLMSDAGRVVRPGVMPFATPADLDAAGACLGPAELLGEAAVVIRSAVALGLSRDDLEAGLREMAGVRAALDACEARFAAEIDRLDDFGDGSAAVLRRVSGCSGAAAKRSAGRAAVLAQMPNVGSALSAGHITAEHADVLASAAGLAGTDAVNDASRLLEVASSTNVESTRRAANDWVRELRAGLTPAEEYRRQRALRSLRISQTAEGLTKATALMDPATGAAFKAIIDDIAQRFADADRADKRPDAPEPRTYTQCRADALAALIGTDERRAALRWYTEIDHGDEEFSAQRWGTERPAPLPPLAAEHLAGLPADIDVAGVRAAVPLPIDAKTGDAAIAHAQSSRRHQTGTSPAQARHGQPAGSTPLPDGAGLRRRNQLLIVADTRAVLGQEWADCEIPGTGPVPARVLERLACGADIFGLIFDGNGQPLWHGRKVRTITDTQWRALVARDRGCVLCRAAPSWCEGHHIVPWKAPARGRTDIENLALLCYRCHDELHDTASHLQRTGSTGFNVAYGRQRE